MLQLLLADYIDFMMIFESKLYDTFPSSQFQIHGFRISHRLDRNYMADFNAEVSETSFSFFLWTLLSKLVDQLQKPYKSIVHRPVSNKLNKQFPKNSSSRNRLIISELLI